MGNNTDNNSPKTPGGISKSLLTPCRRVGLSRNWKKSGPSPFKSPLNNSELISTPAKTETKKRKRSSNEVDDYEKSHLNIDVADIDEVNVGLYEGNDIVSTPVRRNEVLNMKSAVKRHGRSGYISKCESISIESSLTNEEPDTCQVQFNKAHNKTTDSENLILKNCKDNPNSKAIKLNRTKKSTVKSQEIITNIKCDMSKDMEKKENVDDKKKSPKDLTKECIVVIQKNIFKVKSNELEEIEGKLSKSDLDNSQVLFDSDSDDAPLSTLNNKHTIINEDGKGIVEAVEEDDDFIDIMTRKKLERNKENKLEKLIISNTRNKVLKNNNIKKIKSGRKLTNESDSSREPSPFYDEEDDDFDNKRTILIRKTYNKVIKPSKAKSTGSITQKDIDELREQIETKKKLLLAKAMTKDTKELRDLIKKWQKGCQDALVELMDLMRKKFPDKQYMEYSELLKLLNIPTELVGYDSENDSFNTPDDARIILSKFR